VAVAYKQNLVSCHETLIAKLKEYIYSKQLPFEQGSSPAKPTRAKQRMFIDDTTR
jgi:hypothetical protein